MDFKEEASAGMTANDVEDIVKHILASYCPGDLHSHESFCETRSGGFWG